MDAKVKFSLKKKVRFYITLAWSMIGFFILYVIFVFSCNSLFGHPLGYYLSTWIAISLLVTPLFAGLYFNMKSMFTRQILISYKNSIHLYRCYKFARQIVELIEAGDTEKAVDLYKNFNKTLQYSKQLSDIVFGILIGACKLSHNERLEKIFDNKITAFKEIYNPDKIKV